MGMTGIEGYGCGCGCVEISLGWMEWMCLMNECGACVSLRVSYLNEVEAQSILLVYIRILYLCQRTGKQCFGWTKERAVCFVGICFFGRW